MAELRDRYLQGHFAGIDDLFIPIEDGRKKRVIKADKAVDRMLEFVKQPNVIDFTIIISNYVEIGMMDDAEHVLLRMEQEEIKPDVVTFNIVMNGYVKLGKLNEAEKVLERMKEIELKPDVVT